MTDDNANNDPIGKALGITPLSNSSKAISNLLVSSHDDSAKADFEKARSNIHAMIESGADAMFKLSQIAESSQHPRAFEVLAKLMDTMLAANKDLMELQTKIRTINAADSPINEQAKTINNNLFVGSTAELQKVIKEMKNGGSPAQ
jgi:hypothetical protein